MASDMELIEKKETTLNIRQMLGRLRARSAGAIVREVAKQTGYSRVNIYKFINEPLSDHPEVNHKVFKAFQTILKETESNMINPKVKSILWYKYEAKI